MNIFVLTHLFNFNSCSKTSKEKIDTDIDFDIDNFDVIN